MEWGSLKAKNSSCLHCGSIGQTVCSQIQGTNCFAAKGQEEIPFFSPLHILQDAIEQLSSLGVGGQD